MVKITHPHVASLLFDRPLMITKAKHAAIVKAIGGRIGLPYGPGADGTDWDQETDDELNPASSLQNGIAIITAYGSLVKRTVGMNAASGLRGYEQLCSDIMDAATNPACLGILIDVDSFGGEAAGAFDCSDLIY